MRILQRRQVPFSWLDVVFTTRVAYHLRTRSPSAHSHSTELDEPRLRQPPLAGGHLPKHFRSAYLARVSLQAWTIFPTTDVG
jgi:hypothetical protein